MKIGTNFIIFARLFGVNPSTVDSIIFTFKGKNFVTKTYPGDVTYTNGMFNIPFYQEDTVHMLGNIKGEAQINYKTGSVSKTDIININLDDSIHTEIIEGNTPGTTAFTEVEFNVIGESIIAEIKTVDSEMTEDIEINTSASIEDTILSKLALLEVNGNTENIDDVTCSVGDWVCVDLGELNWSFSQTSGTNRFTSSENVNGLPLQVVRTVDIYCPIYQTINDGRSSLNVPDMSIYNSANLERIVTTDSRFNNADDYKKAMKGMYAYFKPASEPSTPTTYCLPIKCNDDFTFISLSQPLRKLSGLQDKIVLRTNGIGYIEYNTTNPSRVDELTTEQLKEIYKLKTFDDVTNIETLTECECDFKIKIAKNVNGALLLTGFANSFSGIENTQSLTSVNNLQSVNKVDMLNDVSRETLSETLGSEGINGSEIL